MDFSKNKRTIIMGILNVTPDSFSDGGIYYNNPRKALKKAKEMFKEGADIIDIGGESTRPGSTAVSEDEELKRILPVIKLIRKKLGTKPFISVDTYKAQVAEECLRNGANIINSLGGFRFDPLLAKVVAHYRCPIVIYHIKGEPRTMQSQRIVYKNVVGEIRGFFSSQIKYGLNQGVRKSQFILDPGVGFGKNVKDNLEIVKHIDRFRDFHLPLLIGVSRKGHLGIIMRDEIGLREIPPPQERIEAGLAEVGFTVLNGAKIVRTHDVLATRRFLSILDELKLFDK